MRENEKISKACSPARSSKVCSPARSSFVILAILIISVAVSTVSYAQEPSATPNIDISINRDGNRNDVALGLQILLMLTILSVAPALVIMTTSFTRIIVVLSFLRRALGMQRMPPNQILAGLALFLTLFIMFPTWETVNDQALKPYMRNELTLKEAYNNALVPIRSFLFKHTRERDLALMVRLSKSEKPKNRSEVATHVLIPAFIISELKTAFQISFLIYIPFLIIDAVVASILMSLGMMMLPPIMISLPLKILLFVLSDGWHLLIGSLVAGFR